MTNVTYTQTDENGIVRDQIYTDKMDHYPKDDHYVFNAPRIMMLDKDKNPWSIESRQGTSEKNGTIVNLWDDVKITQMVGPSTNGRMTVTTTAVTIYPKKKMAVTDKPVTIIQGGSIVNSVGAEVNFQTSSVKLLSKVQGQYEATENKK
jgi:lipopolysaccharide export system protein LptC